MPSMGLQRIEEGDSVHVRPRPVLVGQTGVYPLSPGCEPAWLCELVLEVLQ